MRLINLLMLLFISLFLFGCSGFGDGQAMEYARKMSLTIKEANKPDVTYEFSSKTTVGALTEEELKKVIKSP